MSATLDDIRQSQLDHERMDTERFGSIDKRLDDLPETIKKHVNGSVELTVSKQISGLFRWLGVGGFILLASIGISWGVLITKVDRHEVQLQSALDIKDLRNVELQLSQQATAIHTISEDVSSIKDLWIKQ